MTFKDSILLPSQETLVQRLQHVSLYGQQLIFVTGSRGSGKTRLVTSLVNELEEFSSALVTCPKHCDSSEIRRKILIQLFSEPVFDDEIPLSETIFRLLSSMPQASFIVLDDAHYLPMELVAECIVLSQLRLPGKTISLTLTCDQDFFDELESQLPLAQKETLLSINIDPLLMPEREALYYTLLSRSDQDPFTPREIVRAQLEKQAGTPQEVVNLLELSLNGNTEVVVANKWPKSVMLGISVIFVLLFGCYYLFSPSEVVATSSAERTVIEPVSKPSPLSQYGERILAGYFVLHQRLVEDKEDTQVPESEELTEIITEALDKENPDSQVQISEEQSQATTVSVNTIADTETSSVETFARLEEFKLTEIESTELRESDADLAVERVKEMRTFTGYTIQLASVREIKSLNNLLAMIEDEQDIQLARHGDRWIILLGHFKTLAIANKKSSGLMKKYGLKSPWIRAWKDLVEYELEEGLTTNDIPH
ncbi:AAA family ATPase [Shewanella violacea]|uniref:DamX domain protein n=1 Tax=Shewanella violacea (strain JCM 10179 / CIP 106290 / LMG 19151 / DSS12) TaxID=637905 RepID=D4ZDR5_SHEVD|nr:AAA family ATPase [Shewanella violacea]BAJ03976.1 damX domain protein [Shewanella violacea DSS12]